MKKWDCHICLSAGSVNQWGVCEVCGAEVVKEASLVAGATGAANGNLAQLTAR